jgi:YVTN family beta-propeller protein
MRKAIFYISCTFIAIPILLVCTPGQSAQSGTFTIATVPTGLEPLSVAVNPVTNKIYVVNCNDCGAIGNVSSVTVINGTDNSTATVPTGDDSNAVAVNPVTNKIYVTNGTGNNVTVIDGTNNSTVTVPAGARPVAVAVNSATNKIYVANNASNDVTVIDGTNNSTVTIAAGVGPRGIAVNSVTNKIYVTNQDGAGFGNVTVIDGSNNSTTTVVTGAHPFGVAVNSVTNKIYVACNGGGVTVIDGTNNSTVNLTNTSGSPFELAVNEATNKIYVVPSNSSVITVIDGTNNSSTSVSAAAGGDDPQQVAVDSGTNLIYVAACGTGCEGGDNVFVIDGSDNSTTGIPTPSANTVDIAVNPVTHKVYVVNHDSNDVTVITPPATGNTSVGTNVSVSPAPGVTVTFSQVTVAGDTTATPLIPGNNAPPPPSGFEVDGIVYDISTTASFVPPVTICLPYDPNDPNPRLYHFENGLWVDRTTSIDTVNHIICASVSSLSPFAVLTPSAPAVLQTTFVIGDLNAVVGNKVTFWGSQWARANSLSGGSAPASFKGFADSTSSNPPVCGGDWISHPGNSSEPPASVPQLIKVLVSSAVTKSSSVISGNITKMVVIKTNSGYGPDPGQPGTGIVVSVVCAQPRKSTST